MSLNPFKKQATVGLALGGGGPKGLAHLGVIKKLEEHRIPIDYIAGTSAGALAGLLYAKSKNIAEIEEYIVKKNWFETLSLFTDPSLTQGLLHGNKIKTFVEEYVGKNMTFDKLKIPFKAVAVDIQTGRTVAIADGPVVDAMLASIAIPMIFNPVHINGKYLIDGGITSPVPIETVLQMGADVSVAVNLNKHYPLEVPPDKLNLFQIGRRAFKLMEHNIAMYEVQKADVVIAPDVDEIQWRSLLDEHKKERAIQTGETATQEAIASIKLYMEAKGPLIPRFLKKIKKMFS